MRLRHLLPLLAVFAALGCSSGGESTAPTGGAPKAEGKKTVVGIVFDSGGRGDKSFNDSAYAGVQKAEKEFGIEVKTVDSKSDNDYEENLTGLADGGANLVFAVGFGQATALGAVAPKYADVKFALVDAEVQAPNVRNLLFAEEQGSFLAGYVAALTSKTGKIGFVGGKNIPLIKKFEAGYTAGAKYAKPGIEVLPAKYTESWDDTSTGKQAASLLFSSGADVVYHAAGRAGLGVIAAAKDAGKFAIGVDSDQDDVEKGVVLTSMVKRVDEAVYATIRDVVQNKFTSGTERFDLAKKGVGLSDFRNTRDAVGQDTIGKMEAVRVLVEKGEIKVPDTMEALDAFLKNPPKRPE